MATRRARQCRTRERTDCEAVRRVKPPNRQRASLRILTGGFAARRKTIGLDDARHLDHRRRALLYDRIAAGDSKDELYALFV